MRKNSLILLIPLMLALAACAPDNNASLPDSSPPILEKPNPEPPSSEEPATQIITVEEGDTLFLITSKYGGTVDQLSAANPGVDLKALFVGNKLVVPRTAGPVRPTRYIIQDGDTLALIASQLGITKEELIEANPQLDLSALQVGDELIIP